MSNYIEDLERKLVEIDDGIAAAQTRFDHGDEGDKVGALAELSLLRQRHDDLAQRIATAKEKGADTWSALHMSFREEADALKDTFEKWLTKLL